MLRRTPLRRPRVRELTAADADQVESCLEQAPLETVFLRSEIQHGALRHLSLMGVEHPGGAIPAVSLVGSLVMPWAPRRRDLAALGSALLPRAGSIQQLVGPQDQIAGLQEILGARLRPVRLLRAEQPHYAVDRDTLVLPLGERPPLRRARVSELELMARAGAAMHLEEVGFDPLQLDPVGYRERMLTLIRRGWAYVWMEDGRVAFKAECSAVTAEAVQIQGVWTNPGYRRQGRAQLAMAALAQGLLERTGAVTLFVNDFNGEAIRMYERVGFHRIGSMRTVLL